MVYASQDTFGWSKWSPASESEVRSPLGVTDKMLNVLSITRLLPDLCRAGRMYHLTLLSFVNLTHNLSVLVLPMCSWVERQKFKLLRGKCGSDPAVVSGSHYCCNTWPWCLCQRLLLFVVAGDLCIAQHHISYMFHGLWPSNVPYIWCKHLLIANFTVQYAS